MENKVITLRSVFGKMKEYHFQPGKQKNGARFSWVKPVRYDSQGNSEMILSQDELNDPMRDYFIAEDEDIVVTDGTTFDLNDPLQYNRWMCIRDSDLIVPSRDTRNVDGTLAIDGNKVRYGIAELYVDVPGEESERSVSRKKKITQAWTFIGNDSKNGRLTRCKLLGKDMSNAPDSDVEDYLYQRAQTDPNEIIELYRGGDMALKLLIVDAKQKGIIYRRNGMFNYADNILGATEEAMLLFFKIPVNKPILDQISFEVYPEYAPVSRIEESATTSVKEETPVKEEVSEEIKPINKVVSKKK